MIDLSNKYKIPILFSTKSDTVYDCNINPELHTFQLSITNIYDRKDIEPNVSSIDSRYEFYKNLKDRGFKVGIRIQPFLPNITDLKLVEMFKDADNFTLEGIKIVPQNKEHKDYILKILQLDKNCFTQMGLLNLKPSIRLQMYKHFIEYFNKNNIPFSIADNDLHYIGTNKCCCGDNLVSKSTNFNNMAMLKKYGNDYTIENIYITNWATALIVNVIICLQAIDRKVAKQLKNFIIKGLIGKVHLFHQSFYIMKKTNGQT